MNILIILEDLYKKSELIRIYFDYIKKFKQHQRESGMKLGKIICNITRVNIERVTNQ